MKKIITGKSPAKINLTLDIFPKKSEEAFHSLQTIYKKINLYDVIKIEKSETFEIIGDFDCTQEENLIFRAFYLIKKYFPQKNLSTVKITIQKNIPTGGGLGGGSSNFATFVQLYFELFQLGEIPEFFKKESGNYGKDIPFFFSDLEMAFGKGFGEIIEPLPEGFLKKFQENFNHKTLYLYQPNFKISTPEAFAEISKNLKRATNYTQNFIHNPKIENLGNTFDALLKTEPYQRIGAPRSSMEKVHITGSGSCFFTFEPREIDSENKTKCFEIKL